MFETFATKIKLFNKIFLHSPKEWHFPNRADILIYDTMNINILKKYLTGYKTAEMSIRGESINLICLFFAFLNINFWKGKFIKSYTETFISLVKPKVIITCIDNNKAFYSISKLFPNIKTIIIQNGMRGVSGDVFGGLINLESYHVDYIFSFSSDIGKLYSKYLNAKVIPIGSLKNNAIAKKFDVINTNTVLFISQWEKKHRNGVYYYDHDGKPVLWDEFYEAEIKVLKFLDKWCFKNEKKLIICGRHNGDHRKNEKDFFSQYLNNCSWKLISQASVSESYAQVDNAYIVVHVDSTLGFESLARGTRTACFSCRDLWSFGWPSNFPADGPFWTNHQQEKKFENIMNFLNEIDLENWEKIRKSYIKKIIEFDPGNSKLTNLLDELLA